MGFCGAEEVCGSQFDCLKQRQSDFCGLADKDGQSTAA